MQKNIILSFIFQLKSSLLITLLILNYHCVQSQTLWFNEISSSNTIYEDEDSDTPDWIELLNRSDIPQNLKGWSLTDDLSDPQKWSFPDVLIAENQIIFIWASGKNRGSNASYQTLINLGDTCKYIVPSAGTSNSWRSQDYNDDQWSEGPSGFGYGDNDDATIIPSGSRSVFLRKAFTIDDKEKLSKLFLNIDYDDGFVAYINDIEVARANMQEPYPLYYNTAITDHEAQLYRNLDTDQYELENLEEYIQTGENLLSIQIHNVSVNSSDMTLIPILTALVEEEQSTGSVPPAFLNFPELSYHTNFKLSSNETVYLLDNEGILKDSISTSGLRTNISKGYPLTGSNISFFENPSPNAPNISPIALGIITNQIQFSHKGGVVPALNLSLTGAAGDEVIRYTLDHSIPTNSSTIYNSPISINNNTIVRAKIFKSGFISSPTQTASYLVNTSHSIPIVSLVSTDENLFDEESGIYVLGTDYAEDLPFFGANFWEDWERPMHFTLYNTDNEIQVNQDLGAKIFGGWSRANNQRSFSLFARNEYGPKSISYPLFEQRPYDSYEAIVLRNAGNDWLRSSMRDITVTSLLDGENIEVQAYQTVASYLNGEYWGIYHMREKINEHFLAAKYNLATDKVDIVELNGSTIHGDASEYNAIINYINNNNLADDTNYAWVSSQIDIDNLCLYYATQIYFDNTDWPGNNIKYWKTKNGKWRWILFDTDFSLNNWWAIAYTNNSLAAALQSNGPNWPNPPWSTLLFRKLNENTTFRNTFINRLADLMNSLFLPSTVINHIDAIASSIEPEINRHYNRWGGDPNFWYAQVNDMRSFASQRQINQKMHIRNQYGLAAYHRLNLLNDQPSYGSIKVNSLNIQQTTWQGDYFEDVPISLSAIAAPGYYFDHWEGANTSTEAHISLNLVQATSIKAVFLPSNNDNNAIVINEINYNSSDEKNAGDWIELYNPNNGSIDLSNWSIKDDDDSHSYQLPQGTIMQGDDYLVIARSLNKFAQVYPNINQVIGEFDFGLSSESDQIRLFDPMQNLVDSVAYTSSEPWPTTPNGQGPSLELIDPNLDNALADNWKALNPYGSPAEDNRSSTSIGTTDHMMYFDIYPNPFENTLHCNLEIERTQSLEIDLTSLDGKKLLNVHRGKLDVGTHNFSIPLANLESGLYLIRIDTGKGIFAKKIIKK